MKVQAWIKTSYVDYPGEISACIFTGGCNFRCPYCHNGDLVQSFLSTQIPLEDIIGFLKARDKFISGLVISGGEPCLQKDLLDFIKRIKALGKKVKLDTNGYFPDQLEKILSQNLLDYVAMDIKNTFGKYAETAGVKALDCERLKQSIALISQSHIEHEFRTTVTKTFHTLDDLREIAFSLPPDSLYYLQPYEPSPQELVPYRTEGYTTEELKEIYSSVKKVHEKTFLR